MTRTPRVSGRIWSCTSLRPWGWGAALGGTPPGDLSSAMDWSTSARENGCPAFSGSLARMGAESSPGQPANSTEETVWPSYEGSVCTVRGAVLGAACGGIWLAGDAPGGRCAGGCVGGLVCVCWETRGRLKPTMANPRMSHLAMHRIYGIDAESVNSAAAEAARSR